jgi:hypothetical protein
MDTLASSKVAPGKACGTCMMCCKVLPISTQELTKPPGAWCRHAVTGEGCGIYETRPSTCRTFYCQWMIDPSLPLEWKPDRARLVIESSEKLLLITVDQNFPDAWTESPYLAAIKKWAVEGAAVGRLVLVRIGTRMIAVLPERVVDLGRRDPSDRISFLRTSGPTGPRYDVRVEPKIS